MQTGTRIVVLSPLARVTRTDDSHRQSLTVSCRTIGNCSSGLGINGNIADLSADTCIYKTFYGSAVRAFNVLLNEDITFQYAERL